MKLIIAAYVAASLASLVIASCSDGSGCQTTAYETEITYSSGKKDTMEIAYPNGRKPSLYKAGSGQSYHLLMPYGQSDIPNVSSIRTLDERCAD